MGVMRLGYLQIGVPDLAAGRRHYGDVLGLLETHADAESSCYKAWDEWDHHSLVISSGEPGLRRMGWKVSDAGALEALETATTAFGLSVERMAKGDNPGIGDGFRCILPIGHLAEFYVDADVVGTSVGVRNPDPWPRSGLSGVGVPFLSHVAVTGDDVGAAEQYFSEVLGFHVSERLVAGPDDEEPIVTFLSCGEQVHDIAIQKGPDAKIHHLAYEMESWTDILRGGDVLAMSDVPIDVGPTRHGITRGQTLYFFDPAGNRNEIFSGGYRTNVDRPTVTWTLDEMARGIFYISRSIPERFTTVLT
jgi:catechol 2,3-dioxygenase